MSATEYDTVSEPDLSPIVGPRPGSPNHMTLPIPYSPSSLRTIKLWDIWFDYFHEQYPIHDSRQRHLNKCAKETRQYFASCESWANQDLEHMYLLRLPDVFALSLNVKLDGLEEALQCWLKSGANINVKDNAGLTPLLHMQSSIARGMWRYMRLLIDNGAKQHTTDIAQGFGPLQLALIWFRFHCASGVLGVGKRRQSYMAEMEERLIVLLEAGCYIKAEENWETLRPQNTPPKNTQAKNEENDEACWHVWTQALARFEHRKSLSVAVRDADLLSRTSSRATSYTQLNQFPTSAPVSNIMTQRWFDYPPIRTQQAEQRLLKLFPPASMPRVAYPLMQRSGNPAL
jgi:hypothetical protein